MSQPSTDQPSTDHPSIEVLPDGEFQRVLCVVAHPDDVEYGTSAAIAKWTAAGVDVAYLLLTAGEAGMQRPPDETRTLRAGEQRAACDAVGVPDLTMLDHPDGMLVYSLELRRDIARKIRQFKPDVVVTGAWDIEFMGGLNQADHRAAGLACIDAVRDADNTWVFPELAAGEGLPKWGTTWLLVAGDSRPTHGVDISGEPLELGIASLEAHGAYLGDIPGHPAPRELISGFTSQAGKALGVPNAVMFRVFKLR